MDKQQGPTVYGTENYIQYPVIGHNRKEYENRYIYIYLCVYIYDSLLYRRNYIQHCKSTVLQYIKKNQGGMKDEFF